ncbi:hypothetical protein B0H13DRAFT_1860588 [Mycena leptocephala]|nr:hypothetical protein B0H13DRAFT_1860588 [Mycena leptocephala]
MHIDVNWVQTCEAEWLQMMKLLTRGDPLDDATSVVVDNRVSSLGRARAFGLEPVILAKEACHPHQGSCYLESVIPRSDIAPHGRPTVLVVPVPVFPIRERLPPSLFLLLPLRYLIRVAAKGSVGEVEPFPLPRANRLCKTEGETVAPASETVDEEIVISIDVTTCGRRGTANEIGSGNASGTSAVPGYVVHASVLKVTGCEGAASNKLPSFLESAIESEDVGAAEGT